MTAPAADTDSVFAVDQVVKTGSEGLKGTEDQGWFVAEFVSASEGAQECGRMVGVAVVMFVRWVRS
jgi:hypothetical protein